MKKKTSSKNKVFMKYPSSWHGDMWREAIPVGSGNVGGLVYGGVYKEIIALTHGKFWVKGVTDEMPDVSDSLKDMRALLLENKPIEAENVMLDALLSAGYSPKNSKPYPVCDIEVITKNHERFKNYLRTLNMENAEATVSWLDGEAQYERSFFISRKNDIACLKMTAKDGLLDVSLRLTAHEDEAITDDYVPQNPEIKIEEGKIFFGAAIDGSDFGAVSRVCHDGREIICDDMLTIEGATEITVFTKVFYLSKKEKEWKNLSDELKNICDYEKELADSQKLHNELFSAVTLSLGGENYETSSEELLLDAYGKNASTELLEKLWAFGRYLLICSTREDGYPCQLYGLWTGSYRAMWAFNMFNVNVQMTYWQALSGNMTSLLLSLFDYIEDKLDDFRENARKLYGCRGINLACVSTPESGLHKNMQPHILHWTAGAAWISQFYFDYYLYTGDVKFLRERALPFMRETLLFYEDFLVFDENGRYMAMPSNSPENTPKNVWDVVKRPCEVAVNSTMDFAVLKEVLVNILKGVEITGLYEEDKAKWEEMLTKIPAYQLNDDKTVREWMHPYYDDNNEHRHQSHIYPVFPGYEVTKNNNPELFNSFIKTIEKRKALGLKDQSGWSLTYMTNVYARLGMVKEAIDCCDCFVNANLLPNFLSVHNDWRRMGVSMCDDIRYAPIQVDANMGFTAAVTEMLVFSSMDEIYLFNGLDRKRFSKGNAGPFATRTGSEISVSWKCKKAEVTILQKHFEKNIMMHLPDDMVFCDNKKNSMNVTLVPGKEYVFSIINK